MSEENPYAPPLTNPIPDFTGDPSQQPAARGSRLAASLLDALIGSAITLPIAYLTGYWQRMMAQENPGFFKLPTPEELLWVGIGMVVVIVINWTFLQRGQTIGKKALRIRIVRKDGSPVAAQRIITHRMLPLQIASAIPGLNVVFPMLDALLIFRKDRNTLHDDIADTKVIMVPKNAG